MTRDDAIEALKDLIWIKDLMNTTAMPGNEFAAGYIKGINYGISTLQGLIEPKPDRMPQITHKRSM